MKHLITLLFTLLTLSTFASEDTLKKKIYFLPGLGADYRIFQDINIENFDTTHIHFIRPLKKESLPEYARRLSAQIDTTQPFSLVGVSLGGMISVEMKKFLNPEEVIIIASAKNKYDLPKKYRFFKTIPLHRLFSGRFYIWSTKIAQVIVEPASKANRPMYKAMLNDKDPKFMKRAINFLVKWDNEVYDPKVIQIHGTKDRTLPIRNIYLPTVVIEKGSHMMAYTRSKQISRWLNFYLNQSF